MSLSIAEPGRKFAAGAGYAGGDTLFWIANFGFRILPSVAMVCLSNRTGRPLTQAVLPCNVSGGVLRPVKLFDLGDGVDHELLQH